MFIIRLLRPCVSVLAAAPLFAAFLSAGPASAATTSYGDLESCSFINPNRLQCNFLALASGQTLAIQYVSVECGSTDSTFSLQSVQLLTLPAAGSASEPSYQIPITNQASLAGFVSAASPVSLYARAGSQPEALIDLTPAPDPSHTQCHASISGIRTP
jgi:hypothetical protein